MTLFTQRMSPRTLRIWCGAEYFFFVTLSGGVPISYRCLSRLIHPGVVGFVRLGPDQIFMVDEFTTPSFRRRGITRQMAIAMTPFLLARGYREVLGVHRVDNANTIAAARAKGIPRIGTITRRCSSGRQRFVMTLPWASAPPATSALKISRAARGPRPAPRADRPVPRRDRNRVALSITSSG